MGLIHDAKKQGLWPESQPKTRHHPHLGGLVVESAEGLRFAYAKTPLPPAIGELALFGNNIEPIEIPPDDEN